MKTAVIFDMDGVVSDTQKFHSEVESLILKDFGIDMSPAAITERYSGVADDKMFEEIFAVHGIDPHVPIDEIVFRKWDLMASVASGRITAIAHAPELIQRLKRQGIKLAIASASTTKFIQEVLYALNLAESFDAVVSAQEVEAGKPAPDIFLLAAKRLNVKPEDAVVIEDGRSGMLGATAAGMKSIGLVRDVHADYPATVLVDSLALVTTDMLHEL